VGAKKDPIWRVVVADQRSPRDGRVIETIGHYNAQTDPSTIVIDEDRARSWLARGAQPSNTVRKLLRIQGIETRAGEPAAGAEREPPSTSLTSAEMPSEIPRQLLEYLAEGLVDDPEAVSVEQFEEDDGTIVLELCVADGDYGKVIGRGGRTAHALRTVVKAAAAGEGCHVLVDIVD
jgi:ribosomal protein S16